jgi:hypothetical protein
VIGVGLVKKTSAIEPFHPRNNPYVTRFCTWDVDAGDNRVVMTTSQSFGERAITLRREVRLDGNRVESVNTVTNTGNAGIGLRWFAHPFLPPNSDLTCGKIHPSAILPESAGYEMRDDGMICMKPNYPWEKGLFQTLDVPPANLDFAVPHPIVNSIRVKTDYEAARCALWGNSRTFSLEPFMHCTVRPAETVSWGIEVAMNGL